MICNDIYLQFFYENVAVQEIIFLLVGLYCIINYIQLNIPDLCLLTKTILLNLPANFVHAAFVLRHLPDVNKTQSKTNCRKRKL